MLPILLASVLSPLSQAAKTVSPVSPIQNSAVLSTLLLASVLDTLQAADEIYQTPKYKWAERKDKIFLTILVPHMKHSKYKLKATGQFTFTATSQDTKVKVNITLLNKVHPKEMKVVKREHKIEFVIIKQEKKRWFKLVKDSDASPQLSTDWDKYLDYEDELDEDEKKSGIRGPEPQGDPSFGKAVDDYWRRQRYEKRDKKGEMPSLDNIAKLAEKEHEKTGEDFNEIVQRLWQEAKDDLEATRKKDLEEDEWAEFDAKDEM